MKAIVIHKHGGRDVLRYDTVETPRPSLQPALSLDFPQDSSPVQCQRGRRMTAEPMKAQRIKTDPDPFEPYRLAQGYRVGDLLILSGQAALDETGQIVGKGDFDAQAEQVFANLGRVLAAGGSSLAKVVKVTIYLTDMSHFPKIVELRGKYFRQPYPADTIVEVKALALPDLMIEIEAIALAEGEIVDA